MLYEKCADLSDKLDKLQKERKENEAPAIAPSPVEKSPEV